MHKERVYEQYQMYLGNFPKSFEVLEGKQFAEGLGVFKALFKFTGLGHLPPSVFSSYLLDKECCKRKRKKFQVLETGSKFSF